MRIYLASSWRNKYQPDLVRILREDGHEVYDFRHPKPGGNGFSWSEIDKDWKSWTPQRYAECLEHPIATRGFENDFSGMKSSDACVLLLPCGRSAHLECGWFIGQGKPCFVMVPETCEPELMYRLIGLTPIYTEVRELRGALLECRELLEL